MAKLKLSKVSNTNKENSKFNKLSTTETPTEDTKPSKKYNNLREVMDLNRPFYMMYSGVEDERNFHLLYDLGIRNFLISYQYVQRKHMSVSMYEDMGIKFFVDSGAYTYQVDPKYAEYTVEDWEKQIVRYLNWARKHKDIIFAIANLDLENLLGVEIVKEWNEKYFEPFMLETGIPVCFIWHPVCEQSGWERYCQRYPYVGMSWVSDEGTDLDFNFGKNMLAVAEKYGAVVHGMGMTRTSLLTKLSFYTSDSTTWLVGLQYGEVNFWNGQKMQRLKKDKWKGTYLDRICSKFDLDPELMLEENNEELIKANVGAFIEAEKYIQEKAKARMYWLKPDSVERSASDLDNLEYPDVDWLRGNTNYENWEKYATDFNISKEDMVVAVNCIIDLTFFMNWDNPDYTESRDNTYTPESIKDVHDQWVNRIVSSDEERIEDLREFFTNCLLGKETKLLYLGTNFDRIVKEREDKEYITDEEYILEDITDVEVINTMSKFLPPPKEGESAPEIDELDDEIFRAHEIIPVRDEKGRFIKGQKYRPAPKKMYSKKYPKLSCDTCFVAQKCPEYKAGYVCAYNKMFDRYDTRDMGDIIQATQGIVDYSLGRLQRSMLFETLEGGLPDPTTTQLMNQTMGYLNQLRAMYESSNQEVLRQTRVIRSDGTQETTTQVTNPTQGGILEKIFGGMSSSAEEPKEEPIVVDVESKEV